MGTARRPRVAVLDSWKVPLAVAAHARPPTCIRKPEDDDDIDDNDDDMEESSTGPGPGPTNPGVTVLEAFQSKIQPACPLRCIDATSLTSNRVIPEGPNKAVAY